MIARCHPIPDDLLEAAQGQNIELIRSPDGRRLYCVGHRDRSHSFGRCFTSFDEARSWLVAQAARRPAAGGAP
jgi:hypothetical protein